MQALTSSGAGILVRPDDTRAPDFADRLRTWIDEYRFVVVKNAAETLAEAVDLMSRFGPINRAETRKDGVVMVEDHGKEEVFRSNAALPLHRDGILTGFDVVVVGIYCVAFEDVVGGRTYITDSENATSEVPAEYLEALRENGIEVMAVDQTGYYRKEYEGVWHAFPAYKGRPGAQRPTLAIGLPFAEGEPESWRIRVANVDEELSDRIFQSLRDALLSDTYTYYHDWEPGDLIILDNYEVLHGRESFEARRRQLGNIQVLADEA